MVKNLRSLIHEKFPLDLRVKIDLLSRRRDIVNEEKQDELIKLLREYDIKGVVQLGPGTNRYAIRLDGFVVKFATDHDGKIDNMKEFKMAKRLYPDVSKVYEVSTNGTIMVAEYIPPFESYTEMCRYSDKIKEKLTKIASVYLIGDVGISSINFCNWGIRMGTDDPVCLDFAYVYEVSSELFICRECKVGAMLVPNKEFTELYCSNKACGKRYKFEDIRARIGNDIHRHEIGDLTEEGYILSQSNVQTELTESRSNYLVRKKKKEKKVVVEEEHVGEDNFVMKTPHMYYGSNNDVYNKEEMEMGILDNAKLLNSGFKGSQWTGICINATATAVEPETDEHDDDTVIQYAEAEVIDVESSRIDDQDGAQQDEDDSGVAFSCDIDDQDESAEDVVSAIVEAIEESSGNDEEEVVEVEATIINDVPAAPQPTKEGTISKVNDDGNNKSAKPANKYSGDAGYQTKEGSRFTVRFIDNIERAVSKISNRIGSDLHCRDVFSNAKSYVKDKRMYPETFYRSVQNAVFRSLIQYCGFGERDEPNRNGRGTKKAFIPPKKLDGTHCEPTLVFIERMWNIKDVSMVEDSAECIKRYHEIFNDYLGIQADWLELFRKRLSNKLPIDKNGVDMLCKVIGDVWCTTVTEEAKEPEAVVEEEPVVTNDNIISEDEMRDLQEAIGSTVVVEDAADDTLEGSHDIANDNDEAEDGDEEYYEEQPEYLSVEIYPEDEFDIIKLKTGEAFGPISIPFYCNLNDINVHEGAVSSIVDDRNGIWDWLIHVVPDMMFRTNKPTFWLNVNNEYDETGEMSRFVIMDYDENLGYTMGMYYLSGIFVIDDEGNANPTADEDLIGRCNRVIREAICYSTISHLRRSLMMDELIYEESYIMKMLNVTEEDMNEEEEEEVEAEDVSESPVTENAEESNLISEQEAAAIAAMMMGSRGGMKDTTNDQSHVQNAVPERPVKQTPKQTGDVMPVVRRRKG